MAFENTFDLRVLMITCCLPSDVHHFNVGAQLEQGRQKLVGPAVDARVGST